MKDANQIAHKQPTPGFNKFSLQQQNTLKLKTKRPDWNL